VNLLELPDHRHWLRIPPDALDRLRRRPDLVLLTKTSSGFQPVQFPEHMLHNLAEIAGASFHVVTEVLADGGTSIRLCK
jgi:hypothetical protein